MPDKPLFADIVLPLAISGLYTYRVPDHLWEEVKSGVRVVVPLGPRKMYTGIVSRTHDEPPPIKNIKAIIEVLDPEPLVRSMQLQHWEWISEYYMCSIGEVLKAGLPGGLKLESESRFEINEEFDSESDLSEEQSIVYNYLKDNGISDLQQISDKTGLKSIQKIINSLLGKAAVLLEERLKEAYRPKSEIYIRLTASGKETMEKIGWESDFNRAPVQLKLLQQLHRSTLIDGTEVKQSSLYNEYSLSTIKALTTKGMLEKYEVMTLRERKYSGTTRDIFPLSSIQSEAFNKIQTGFQSKNVQLLHGVTSSGKTEIYIHLIKDMLDQGKQILYLLPEIALTSQIVSRIEEVFGDLITVYHSKFSDNERVDVYKSLLEGKENEKKIILGVRSALFLPFRDLGLIIVDEEHENSFKQIDPAPRYHARDSAIVLAKIHKANVLLGTATPSIESYYNCKSGKYGLVNLKERFGGVLLPEIRVIDIRKSRKKKEMVSVFTRQLVEEVQKVIVERKQVILFQNRRGYSSFLECESCGWIPRCSSCDVSLTYHKAGNLLRCHYCGNSIRVPYNCQDCNSTRLITRGFGTELVEDELGLLIPGAKIARLDLDSTRTVKSYERILQSFGAGEIDILVGTQMLSKGLDFENVALVGILNADQMLNFPDFRAFERSFQLMSQVSGRSGRKKDRGRVIIQTSDPGHPIISHIIHNNYDSFYREQILERQEFKYPPFVRMIRIQIKSREFSEGQQLSIEMAKNLSLIFGNRILGPQPPVVGRVKSWYIQQIIIKIERTSSFGKARNLIRNLISEMEEKGKLKKVRINLDVDPL